MYLGLETQMCLESLNPRRPPLPLLVPAILIILSLPSTGLYSTIKSEGGGRIW